MKLSGIVSLLLLWITLTPAKAQTKIDIAVSDFNGIEVSGAFEVFIRMGSKSSLTVIAEDHIQKRISAEVQNGILEVGLKSDWTEIKSGKAALYITVQEIESIELSGACKLQSKNTLIASTLSVVSSGASQLTLSTNTGNLNLEVSGAGKLELTGKSGKVNMESSGASVIYASNLQADNMSIEASGASKIEVNVKSTLNVEASGATKILYSGNPSVVNKETSGAATIEKA